MAVYAGLNIDTRNLIAYYDAGNKKSLPSVGTTWFDLSGNGLNGTIQGNPTFSNDGGGSILFDGSGDYVSLPANSLFAIGTGAFTLHAWYKHNTRSGFSTIFDFGGGSNSGQGILSMGAAASSYPFGLYYYANGWQTPDYNLSFNTWELVTLVGNGAADGSRNITMYRNGKRGYDRGLSVYTVNYNFTNNEPRIGQNKAAGGEVMRGNIASVAYYNRAFNADEVMAYYNESKSRFESYPNTNLIYRTNIVRDSLALLLDGASYSGSGTTWPDTSGNGRDATLINSPTYSTNNGGVFIFNGATSTAYANTAYVLPASASFTMGGFARSRGSNGGTFYNRVFGNADSAGGSVGASIIFKDSGTERVLYGVRRGNGGNDVSYTPDLTLSNTWHYVAMTYDTSTGLRLFIDTQLIAYSATLGFGSSLTFRVARDGNAADAFNGEVGLVHIHNKALSNTELQQIFNAYRGRYGI